LKYIVTGGAGFIGSCLVNKLLINKHKVIVVDDLSLGTKDNVPNDVDFTRTFDGIGNTYESILPYVLPLSSTMYRKDR